MVKRALLIGINYVDDDNARLHGCINDIMSMHNMLIDAYDYEKSNIVVLRDDKVPGFELPTRNNIMKYLGEVIAKSGADDELWIHYSGHGSYIRDTNNEEYDRKDEVLVPCDYSAPNGGVIVDDELKKMLEKCRALTYITNDCCHSGTGWDLPYLFRHSGSRVLRYRVGHPLKNSRIYMLSGSRDHQTAADSYSQEEVQSMGAFTMALIECLRFHKHHVSLMRLHKDVNQYLAAKGYQQICEFSSSTPFPDKMNIMRSKISESSQAKLTSSIIQQNMRKVMRGRK